jgi:hypothetical protein
MRNKNLNFNSYAELIFKNIFKIHIIIKLKLNFMKISFKNNL